MLPAFKILTRTSKMPCHSFSLKAWETCPGAKIGETLAANDVLEGARTVCSSCYARKGFYRMPNVSGTQDARTAWTRGAVEDGTFAAVLIKAIRDTGDVHFRVHDSGDFFSVEYVNAWIEVCAALPGVSFWFPTRAYTLAAFRPALARLASLPNVTVRPSALLVDGDAPEVAGLHAGTCVGSKTSTCPAASQAGECRDCRACWTERDRVVTYGKH